jgi:hypothetical protein
MKSIHLLAILLLAGLLLITFFAFVDQTARADEPDPPFPADAYLNLRPYGSTRQDKPLPFTRVDPQALANTDVMTNVLDLGDNMIHGFIYYDGYLWGSTRTKPARILKIDPSTLEVDTRIILASGQNYGDDIVAAQGYIWVILFTNPAQLIRVDPDTVTAEVAVTFDQLDFIFGASLEYAFGYLWAGGRERIAQIDISDPLTPTYQSYDYSSLVVDQSSLFNALTSNEDYLWGSMYQLIATEFLSSTVVRIDPDIPTNTLTETFSVIFPDDITYAGSHLYISSEDIGYPSDIYQFDTDPSTYTITRVADSASYGTFLNPLDHDILWGVYLGYPGIIKKFDLIPSALVTITLPLNFDDPNELAFDESGNMYATTWAAPAGIVKYPAPTRVTDLGISQSGSDVVLNWGHLGGDVTHYQVWRSTERSFTPGDDLSAKIGEAIPIGSTVTFTDNNAVGELIPNYYYVVKSVNSYGLVSPASNEVSLASTTTTITSHLPDPSAVGQDVAVMYSVTSSGGTPTGDVTVGDGTVSCTGTVAAGSCSLTFTSAGLKTLVATYEGDDDFDDSISVGVSHKVTADTTTTITSHLPDPSAVGQDVTVMYSVTSIGGTPTGDVTVGDGTVSCTGTVAAGSCSLTFTSSGLKTLVATYEGDDYFNSSISAGISHKVTADTTTTITSHSPNPSSLSQVVTVLYSVISNEGTPTGNVTVSGGTDSCTNTVTAGSCVLTFTSIGPKTLVAAYEGDDDFSSSISAGVSHRVTGDTTTTITSSSPNPSTLGQAVTVLYSVTSNGGTPTGNVTVSDGTDSCTNTVAAGSCSLTFTSIGAKTLVAAYEGDDDFNSSISAGVSHIVNKSLYLPLINYSASN